MRRSTPFVLIALALALLLGWYVAYTQRVVSELRREASRSARMYARVYGALSEPSEEDATAALLDLSAHIAESGVPVIVTDTRGRPTAAANLPFRAPLDGPRVADFVRELDRENAPVAEPGVGTVHYGHTPLVRGLRVIPAVQAGVLALLLAAAAYALRTRGRAEREKVWAGMARESAHQLGTPLSSLSGWIELLTDRDGDDLTASALAQMRSDLDRLERVAHRFERIGRPPRKDPLDVAALATRVAVYFAARVPTLAQAVVVRHEHLGGDPTVRGDPVLVEWAAEVLVKNAIDALAGRGGRVEITTVRLPDGAVRLRVADDGPGVPREIRARIFAPGFSTKERGWGVGLSLAKRIVEEYHGGKLLLVPGDRGATFDVILP
jgi:signal transduction histidine kinase